MEKYSKAVSEVYSQFKKREAHPMEKYIGRLVIYRGKKLVVVGYSYNGLGNEPLLIADASQSGGWTRLCEDDVIFKRCAAYSYAIISNLIN
jgi:hypothetical protein